MRYTIPGYLNDCARVTVRKEPMPLGEWLAIIRRGDRLRGFRGNGAVARAAPVHRERVRFGAWEARPQGAAVGRLGPGTGGSEGPQIPGPENTYKCEGGE